MIKLVSQEPKPEGNRKGIQSVSYVLLVQIYERSGSIM